MTAAAPEARDTGSQLPRDRQAGILVVDDNPAKRMALRAVLEPLGHRVVEAQSGTEALRCVLAEDFAVILLDVQMPDMNGFQTAELIRTRRQSEMTPILFITAHSSDEIDQTDHYAGGAVDFIFAPIPPAELRSKVSFFAHVFLDARKLAVQAQAVQASVEHLELLTESAPIGIFETDQEDRYTYTNPRWTEITGVSSQAALGRAWDSIIAPERRDELALARSRGSELSHRVELVSGSSRIVLVSSGSVADADGGAVGWVGTLTDVTLEKHAEDAMAAARDSAVLANVMQRNFAASASHELRTPTASIIGYVEELLLSESLDPDDRELLDVVYRNAGRLNRLIDDLSTLNRAELGAPKTDLEPTDLGAVVDRVVASLTAAAQERGTALEVADEGRSAPVLADPVLLERSLVNLVGNAIKFTPRGGTVSIRVEDLDGMGSVVVADTGLGIETSDFEKVFERFYRTRSAVDGAVPGSGLGLSIAKVMVEAQGGTIGLESTPGQGSTFTVLLPAAGCRTPAS